VNGERGEPFVEVLLDIIDGPDQVPSTATGTLCDAAGSEKHLARFPVNTLDKAKKYFEVPGFRLSRPSDPDVGGRVAARRFALTIICPEIP